MKDKSIFLFLIIYYCLNILSIILFIFFFFNFWYFILYIYSNSFIKILFFNNF
ncbi:hypothetical protein U3516DRAFT_352206 [Neocallimastix sp. 'constans']